MTFLYVKTMLTIPGHAPITHVAELEPLSAMMCRPQRMLEMSGEAVAGAYRRAPHALENFSTPPQERIPHPDQWANMPDIEATQLTAAEFETLWLEAEQKFNGLAQG